MVKLYRLTLFLNVLLFSLYIACFPAKVPPKAPSPGHKFPANVLIVTAGTASVANMFTSIKAAVDSIHDASATKLYTVLVGPGIFVEDTITLKPYINLIGSASFGSIIKAKNPGQNIIIAAPSSTLERCYLQGTSGAGTAAVFYNQPGVFRMSDCRFGTNNILVNVIASNALPGTHVTIDRCTTDSTANFVTGFSLVGNPAMRSTLFLNNYSWAPAPPQPQLQSFVTVQGSQNTVFQGIGLILGIPFTISTPIGGNCFTIMDGAQVRLENVVMRGFDKGIYVPYFGLGPALFIAGVSGKLNVMDLQIDHPLASGSIQGSFSRKKTVIHRDADISLFLNDPENSGTTSIGSMYIGKDFAHITDILPQIQQSATLGLIGGGLLKIDTGLNIKISAGSGYLMVDDSPYDSLKHVEWEAQILSVPSNQSCIIYIDMEGIAHTTTENSDHLTSIKLGHSLSSNTAVLYVQQMPNSAVHTASSLNETLINYIGPIFKSGSLVSKNGLRQLNVAPGNYAVGALQFFPSGGVGISWQAIYSNGSGSFFITEQNSIDYNHYDNGTGGLALLPQNYFTRHGLCVIGDGSDEKYLMIYGKVAYNTLADAQNDGVPPQPFPWMGNTALIGSIITQNTTSEESQIVEIRDERPRIAMKPPRFAALTEARRLRVAYSATPKQAYGVSISDFSSTMSSVLA